MPGSPDWQQITEWFGAIQAQGTAVAIGATTVTLGPFDLSTYSSVIVAVKPTGGTITGTITQTIPGGPAALTDVTTFTVADGAVVYEAVVLLAGQVTVTLTGSAGGETVTYAVVPANTNTNANVTSGASVTSITPTPLASWPPSSPVGGDLQILELPTAYDPTFGQAIRWLCQYDNATGLWTVLGGPPLESHLYTATSETVANAGYNDFTTPTICTMPRNGVYVAAGGAGKMGTGTGTPYGIGIKMGTAATSDDNATISGVTDVAAHAEAMGQLTAGDTVRLQRKQTFGNPAAVDTRDRYLYVMPRRIS